MNERQQLMAEFLRAMYVHVPEAARVMSCQFRGDPNAEIKGKWVARPLTRTVQLDDGANVYLAVSAMGRNERGEYRRRKENFVGGILLMIDDIGTGPGSKFPMAILDAARPTALIETSPNNHQAVYMFSELVTDPTRMDSLVTGFILKQFLGKDTGMAGINRVFRPPFGVNGKPKYGGWRVRCVDWAPERRYSVDELARAFGIELGQCAHVRKPSGATVGKADGMKAFVNVRQALRSAGMLRREEADMSGWQDVVCPWTDGHTDHANNGAAIREPNEENGWVGAFRCHHGSCEGRGWKALTDWIAENQAEMLDRVNDAAPSFKSLLNKSFLKKELQR